MKPLIGLMILLSLVSACQKAATPTMPSADPVPPGPPARIALTITRGLGASADRGFIVGTVYDAANVGLQGVAVTLTTAAGAVDVSPVTTTFGGQFQGALTSAAPTTVTASAGAASSSASVPISSSLPATLTVFVTPVSGTTNVPVHLGASIPQGAQVTSYAWLFGDEPAGTAPVPAGAQVTHTYTHAGTFAVSVSITDVIGRIASGGGSATISDPPPPPPPPAPSPAALVVTLNCVPGAHATVTACNVAATYGAAVVPSNQITSVTWDWGEPPLAVIPNSPVAQHTYSQAGLFLVTATVTATTVDGPKTASAGKTLTIN